MPIKTILAAGFFFLGISLQAQTKLIAHKSHSGNISTFSIVLENELFDTDNSNFGMAPEPTVTIAKLDSVIYLSDTAAVMITSYYCENVKRKRTSLWNAGRDTVYHHGLFTKKHALDSIKNVLKRQYHFKNPVDSVKFIGYDNGGNCETGNYETFPVITFHDNDRPPFNLVFILSSSIILLSLLAGLLSWKFYPVARTQKA